MSGDVKRKEGIMPGMVNRRMVGIITTKGLVATGLTH
jgi:hypothetical protein